MAAEPGGGRRRGAGTALACAMLLVGSPLFVAYVWLCCEAYGCAISGPLLDVALGRGRSPGRLLLDGLPRPTLAGCTVFAVWYAAQAALAIALPGRIGHGAITPAGHRPAYRLNGLLAWLVTHVLLGLAVFRWRLFPPTIVADNSGGLLVAANGAGLLVAVLAYGKARRFPSRPADRRWRGHAVSDFFMGVELNPRIGPLDLKLFHIGRVGMMAWTAVNASFAAKQFQELGYVTGSMILVNLLQLVYVLDFFAREDWYLRTIDMHHDRFGFYLAWGSAVWIPFVYTLQAAYLARHPVRLSPAAIGRHPGARLRRVRRLSVGEPAARPVSPLGRRRPDLAQGGDVHPRQLRHRRRRRPPHASLDLRLVGARAARELRGRHHDGDGRLPGLRVRPRAAVLLRRLPHGLARPSGLPRRPPVPREVRSGVGGLLRGGSVPDGPPACGDAPAGDPVAGRLWH